MVRILSTGEIVADDDPRGRQAQPNARQPQQMPSQRRGAPQTLPPGDDGDGRAQQRNSQPNWNKVERDMSGWLFGRNPFNTNNEIISMQAPFAGRSNDIPLLESLNNKLLELGIPRIPLGNSIVIDPIYTVMILILLLVFGLPGLLLVGLIFLVKSLSRQDNQVGQFLSSFLGLRNTPNAAPAPTNTPAGQRPPPSASSGNKKKFSGHGNRLGD
uniref:DUF4605 domain-containing protein n=1 Tax=Plectus sambesii TaxID=2011161 RepID=A0A914W0L0_9BILA